MELIAALNDYSGGLLVTLIVGAVTGWLKQRSSLRDVDHKVDITNMRLETLLEKLNDPKTGVVPRIEYEGHRDATNERLNRIEPHVLHPNSKSAAHC